MDTDQELLLMYQILKTHRLNEFYSDFVQVLQLQSHSDLLNITQSNLQQIGIVSQKEIKNFETLQKALKNEISTKQVASPKDLEAFLICQHIRSKEAVIITDADIVVQNSIGSGHFGKVYKGIWKPRIDKRDIEIEVALKSLSDGGEMSWRKEVSIFTSLNQKHGNIIKFYGLLIDGNESVKMVTEYAKYGSLIDRLRERSITSISLLGQFAVQISSGMIYLHSSNLVHRDLSARNILVTAHNQVKISDFGLSKILNENESEWIMETKETLPIRWLSPESYNYGVFTAASDVWSYGVVLWEMFTFGDVPWATLNNEQVKVNIGSGLLLPEPQFCPFGFYDIIKSCFQFEPTQRPKFQIIFNELSMIQPNLVEIVVPSTSPYDLSVQNGDMVTAIKPLNSGNQNLWLGQNERTLLFGQFDRNSSVIIDSSIPYDHSLHNNCLTPSHSVDEDKENEPDKSLYKFSEDYFRARENFLRQSERESEPYVPSKLNFKETDPFSQETVNDRISRNWDAFLTHCETLKPTTTTTDDIKTDIYLQPTLLTNEKSSIQSLINSIDPYAKSKSQSQENIQILDTSNPISNAHSTGNLNSKSVKRDRPKPGNEMSFYRSKNKPSNNVLRLDGDSPTLNMEQTDFLTSERVNRNKMDLSELISSGCDVKNQQYLMKYSHIVPVSAENPETQKLYRMRLSSLNENTAPSDNTDNSNVKTPKHFVYDPKAELCELPKSKKERAKLSVSNYTNNSWDLFEDCVKDKKKIDKLKKKNSANEISWPLDASNSSLKEEDNLSAKFQQIRKNVPNSNVTECLDALRLSNNNVKKAIHFLHVGKLLQLKLGFSTEKCAEVLAKHNDKFEDAEKNLILDYFCEKFKELHRNRCILILEENRWQQDEASKKLFFATCAEIGVDKQRAHALLIENKDNPIKSLEVAKILRLAEITSQSEHSCFRTLAYCEWNLERAIEYNFSK